MAEFWNLTGTASESTRLIIMPESQIAPGCAGHSHWATFDTPQARPSSATPGKTLQGPVPNEAGFRQGTRRSHPALQVKPATWASCPGLRPAGSPPH